MKTVFVSTVILFATTFNGAFAFANSCRRQAVTAARSSTSEVNRLRQLDENVANKTYLVSYTVTFADSVYQPSRTEVIDVVLMRSDCSVVSVKPRL